MRIVLYDNAYRTVMEKICLNGKEDVLSLAMTRVFLDTYLNINPSCSLVLLDDEREVKGYLVASSDFDTWQKKSRVDLKDAGPLANAILDGSLAAMRPYKEDYPAHFHIDLDPSIQHQGYGTLLLRCLEEKLILRNVKGYMLNVSVENKKAIAFYQKNGFVEIGRNDVEIAFGKHLGKRK